MQSAFSMVEYLPAKEAMANISNISIPRQLHLCLQRFFCRGVRHVDGAAVLVSGSEHKKKTCIKTHYCSGIILTNYYTISIIVLHNIVRVKNTVFNPRDDWNKQELHSNGPRCKVYFGGSCIFYIFWTNGSNSHIFNHIYPLVN